MGTLNTSVSHKEDCITLQILTKFIWVKYSRPIMKLKWIVNGAILILIFIPTGIVGYSGELPPISADIPACDSGISFLDVCDNAIMVDEGVSVPAVVASLIAADVNIEWGSNDVWVGIVDAKYADDIKRQGGLNKDKYFVDDKFRLRANHCHEFEQMECKEYTIYSFSLETPQEQYGIYANGLLVETTIPRILRVSDMEKVSLKKEKTL